jgi:hypothetical protein
LERAERPEPGDGGDGAEIDQLALVQHEARGGERAAGACIRLDPRGDLPEAERNPDAAIRRIRIGEHRRGEHRHALIGRVRVLQHVILESDPQVFRLVEHRRLRSRVRVDEGRLCRGPRFGRGSPPGIAAPHQMSAVEVVVGVDGGSGLRRCRHARVQIPVARAGKILQRAPVDVHAGHRGQPSSFVERHREAEVGQVDQLLRAPGVRHPDRDPQEVRVVT